MSLKTDLYSQLSTYAGLTALVGTRIYPPKKVPQNVTWPYCVYQIISQIRQYSHQGYSYLERFRIQIDCYAQDINAGQTGYAQIDGIRDQVIAAMEAWRAANSKVQSCFQDDQSDFDDDTEVEFDRLTIDFTGTYNNG